MTLYALITAGAVVAVGPLPSGARRLSDGAWITPPGGTWTDQQAAECGYLPVVTTAKPADTETTVHERGYALVDGVPTEVWPGRPKAAEELAADTAAAEREAVRALVKAIVNDLQSEKARAQAVIDTANATINAGPAGYVKDCARAAKRIAVAAIDLARHVKDL